MKYRAEAVQNDPVMQFVMCLLHSVTNTHILHFNTPSYSEHMALSLYPDACAARATCSAFALVGNGPLLPQYHPCCVLRMGIST